MILLLVRHGVAADPSGDGDDADAARPLTEKGRRKLRPIARFLARAGLRPTHLFTSHRRRSIQTAQELAEQLGLGIPLQQLECADMDSVWDDLTAELASLDIDEESVVMVVGHMPSIGHFLGAATTDVEVCLSMKKGAVAAIRFDGLPGESPGALMFYMTARTAELLDT
jgi:phosphohistidine phosphatase SixA